MADRMIMAETVVAAAIKGAEFPPLSGSFPPAPIIGRGSAWFEPPRSVYRPPDSRPRLLKTTRTCTRTDVIHPQQERRNKKRPQQTPAKPSVLARTTKGPQQTPARPSVLARAQNSNGENRLKHLTCFNRFSPLAEDSNLRDHRKEMVSPVGPDVGHTGAPHSIATQTKYCRRSRTDRQQKTRLSPTGEEKRFAAPTGNVGTLCTVFAEFLLVLALLLLTSCPPVHAIMAVVVAGRGGAAVVAGRGGAVVVAGAVASKLREWWRSCGRQRRRSSKRSQSFQDWLSSIWASGTMLYALILCTTDASAGTVLVRYLRLWKKIRGFRRLLQSYVPARVSLPLFLRLLWLRYNHRRRLLSEKIRIRHGLGPCKNRRQARARAKTAGAVLTIFGHLVAMLTIFATIGLFAEMGGAALWRGARPPLWRGGAALWRGGATFWRTWRGLGEDVDAACLGVEGVDVAWRVVVGEQGIPGLVWSDNNLVSLDHVGGISDSALWSRIFARWSRNYGEQRYSWTTHTIRETHTIRAPRTQEDTGTSVIRTQVK